MGNGALSRPRAVRGALALLGVTAATLLATALASSAAAAQPRVPPPPPLPAKAAVLTVLGTGQQLYGLNPTVERPIASTTKLMTALQVLTHASLNTIVTEPNFHFAADDSQIYLSPGERMSIHDLMIAMLLPSADDAAEDLAYNVGGGSLERFIAMMNRGARALHLNHTHYSTPIGLDTPGNYSTASDLVKLAGYLLQHYPFFARVVALPAATLATGNHPRYVINRNDLVARFSWIHGVKTGHTTHAGYVLVGEGRKDGMTLLSAVLGTPSEAARDNSTLSLLDWGYANFHIVRPLTAGRILARPTANGYSDHYAPVIPVRGFAWAVPRAAHVRLRIKLAKNINGPLKRHARVGSVTVLDGTKPVGHVPLVLERALAGLSLPTRVARFITKPISLVVLIVILAAVALAVLRRSRRRVRSVRA
jgi:D-alanyl-D-alanine carboxypeptidase (penicillin-binding protein 5/6)